MTTPPQPGTYSIINRVLNASGEKLAITFNGQGNLVTVTPLVSGNSNQKWTVARFTNTTFSVSPVSATSLQAALASGSVTVSPANNYVFTISGSGSNFTIRNGQDDPSTTWGVPNASDNDTVDLGTGDNYFQQWIFETTT